jgi:hypothetical protein
MVDGRQKDDPQAGQYSQIWLPQSLSHAEQLLGCGPGDNKVLNEEVSLH